MFSLLKCNQKFFDKKICGKIKNNVVTLTLEISFVPCKWQFFFITYGCFLIGCKNSPYIKTNVKRY